MPKTPGTRERESRNARPALLMMVAKGMWRWLGSEVETDLALSGHGWPLCAGVEMRRKRWRCSCSWRWWWRSRRRAPQCSSSLFEGLGMARQLSWASFWRETEQWPMLTACLLLSLTWMMKNWLGHVTSTVGTTPRSIRNLWRCKIISSSAFYLVKEQFLLLNGWCPNEFLL